MRNVPNQNRFSLIALLILLGVCTFSLGLAGGEEASKDHLPVKGTVTLVELGADNCIPCRLQKPIIAELQKEYQGRAAVVSIDVYRERDAAEPFHILVTPTLIFYDREGHEDLRHAGFLDKAGIVEILDRLLARQEK